MNDLTITIVSYHNEKDIRKAIESIEKYTPETIKKQIYIVDNSEEKERNLGKLSEQYPDVAYLRTEKNLGFGGGHNYVLKRLDSKYHAIVNPDIILKEDASTPVVSLILLKNATV